MSRFVYLHGFASSPGSKKASCFRTAFAELGWELEVPDLNPPDFRDLTIGSMIEAASAAVDRAGGAPVGLIGSSLGGYVAATLASRRDDIGAVALLAPAFDLQARWSARLGPGALDVWERMGSIPVFHHGLEKECLLGYEFYAESRNHESHPDPGGVPVLAFHGRRDDVVPPECVEEFVRRYPSVTLRMLDDDHSLVDSTDAVVREAVAFFTERLE